MLSWRSGGGLWWRPTRRGIASRKLIETMGGGGSRSRPQASPGRIPHRTKDFLMPEKTHGRSLRHRRGVGALLELLRRLIAQRRVQPAAIVVTLDELLDVRA